MNKKMPPRKPRPKGNYECAVPSPDTELKRANLAKLDAMEREQAERIADDFFKVCREVKPITAQDIRTAWKNYDAWTKGGGTST